MSKKIHKQTNSRIATNKRAAHDYAIEYSFEAGIVLSGWEVKALRAGRASLVDSYVVVKESEAYVLGSSIQPLSTISTHVIAEPDRTRKLLLHKKEIAKIFSAVTNKGYTCILIALYWKKHLVKCQIAIAKGKKEFDKRQSIKAREANLDMQRAIRSSNKKNAGY